MVKTQANQHKTQTGVDLTYKQYSNLLLSAASQFDAQLQNPTIYVLLQHAIVYMNMTSTKPPKMQMVMYFMTLIVMLKSSKPSIV